MRGGEKDEESYVIAFIEFSIETFSCEVDLSVLPHRGLYVKFHI